MSASATASSTDAQLSSIIRISTVWPMEAFFPSISVLTRGICAIHALRSSWLTATLRWLALRCHVCGQVPAPLRMIGSWPFGTLASQPSYSVSSHSAGRERAIMLTARPFSLTPSMHMNGSMTNAETSVTPSSAEPSARDRFFQSSHVASVTPMLLYFAEGLLQRTTTLSPVRGLFRSLFLRCV